MQLCKKLLITTLLCYSPLIFAQAVTVFLGGTIVTVNSKNEEVQAIAV
jgi:hypothetical protein